MVHTPLTSTFGAPPSLGGKRRQFKPQLHWRTLRLFNWIGLDFGLTVFHLLLSLLIWNLYRAFYKFFLRYTGKAVVLF